jgi:hypothetical protein
LILAALIIGALAGYNLTSNAAGAVAGAVGLPLALFIARAVIGYRSMQHGKEQVPIDLAGAPNLDTASLSLAYKTLPLAQRNAIVAREVARAADRPVESIVDLLAELMGRNRLSNETTQRSAAAVLDNTRASWVDMDHVAAICEGEVDLAAQSSMPPNDRVRAVFERNLGAAVDLTFMRGAILTSRMPRMNATVDGLIEDAINGRRNLAFVVGTIRKVGEYHAREIVKVH